jgi:glycine C-acetyltransferase/8-amino-7-oxononanoate synthase
MSEAPALQQVDKTYVLFKGKKLIFFAGCDYLRMSSHPKVLNALNRSAREAGLNVAASRLTTGNHILYHRLEEGLRRFFRASSATLVQTGYLTNFIAAQALSGQFSHALIDSAAHPALKDAALFLDCPALTFPSRDPDGLNETVKRCGAGCKPIVLTDGMFARDGTVAPLKQYLKVLPTDARILVDDAHAAGVIGRRGGGSVEHCGVARSRLIQTVTLSKAFGVFGGAILGGSELRKRIFRNSTIFVASTPLPLPLAGASLEAVRIVSRSPGLLSKMHRNAERVRARLRAAGFDLPKSPGPVFGLVPRSTAVTQRLSNAMLKAGIFPSLMRYPGTPPQGLFRFVISSEHTPEQLDRLAFTLERFSPEDLTRA